MREVKKNIRSSWPASATSSYVWKARQSTFLFSCRWLLSRHSSVTSCDIRNRPDRDKPAFTKESWRFMVWKKFWGFQILREVILTHPIYALTGLGGLTSTIERNTFRLVCWNIKLIASSSSRISIRVITHIYIATFEFVQIVESFEVKTIGLYQYNCQSYSSASLLWDFNSTNISIELSRWLARC